ncbi:MAG: hypothetical protein AAB316_05810 [Bacteroidota bacterium]
MRLIFQFLLLLLFVNCRRKDSVEISGIPLPSDLLEMADDQGFDYTGNLSKALKNNESALIQLFNFSQKTDSSVVRQHGQVLLSLLAQVGDANFSTAISRQSSQVIQPLWDALAAGASQPLKIAAPLTWQALLPKTEAQAFQGLFFKTEKFDGYLDCAEPGSRFLAVDETGEMEANYKRLLRYPYPGQAIFAAVKGFKTDFFGGKTLPGNYRGFFVITEILGLEVKTQNNTCIPYDFWARGTEPFWQAQISAAEDIIEFQSVDDRQAKVFAYAAPVQEDSALIFTAVNQATGDNLRLSVRADTCSDGVSDPVFPFKIQATVNGKNFSGCGIGFEK